MSEISSLALGAGMTQERLKSYIDDRLSTRKAKDEIEEELMNFGLDREMASGMVRDVKIRSGAVLPACFSMPPRARF